MNSLRCLEGMMGITITANNSKYSFNMGYGGFFNLRTNLAKAYDEEFGELYSALRFCKRKAVYAFFDKVCNDMLSDERFKEEDNDIIDFLFMPDSDGKIRYRTCGKLYNLIKDIDFGDKRFQFCKYSKGNDYEQFKVFLKECYSHRRNLRWY